MKTFIVLAVIFSVTLASAIPKSLSACDTTKCKLPDCQCSKKTAPVAGSPQFVMLSFTDAAAKIIYDSVWEKILFGGKNPDGCPISGTFFIPHEFSNYEVVNKLYNEGFEIASHSITKTALVDYWKSATKEEIISEMGGQRDILAKFANIPKDKIIGSRIPLLQINKATFQALQEAGFRYDASWPTRQEYPFFPYTLDYASEQICAVDSQCYTEPIKGFWEIPIVDWVSQADIPCNSLFGCATTGTADEIFEWMKKNFETVYKSSRAPFSIIIDYAWFAAPQEHQDAIKKFMDYLKAQKDVYLVSHSQVLAWSKNPTKEFSSCQTVEKAKCTPVNCQWKNNRDQEKYMVSCVKCPKNYPWLNNPLGN